jgi:hypothetical protein
MYDFSNGFSVEVWFRLCARELRLLDLPPLQLSEIEPACRKHLLSRVERALPHMSDPTDPELWLDLILKADTMLKIEDCEGNLLRCAVDVTALPREATNKLDTIKSQAFKLVRRQLKIDRHWIVLVSPRALPSRDWLIDALYEQADRSVDCAIINLLP